MTVIDEYKIIINIIQHPHINRHGYSKSTIKKMIKKNRYRYRLENIISTLFTFTILSDNHIKLSALLDKFTCRESTPKYIYNLALECESYNIIKLLEGRPEKYIREWISHIKSKIILI